MKRVELATDVQGIDYIYTVQGWLKAINHGDPVNDPGQDGMEGSENYSFKPDAFGMTMEYYDHPAADDYTGAGYSGGDYNLGGFTDFYSGTIKGIGWHNANDHHQQSMYGYGYDDKYQLTSADFGTITPVGSSYNFTDALGKYAVSIPGGYDRHGNIQSLIRKDGAAVPAEIADYDYHYINNTNKLDRVDHNNVAFLDYSYNSIGQMVSQTESGGPSMYVTYNAYGLVTGVYADAGHTQPIVLFDYDDRGFRLAKHVYNESSQEILATWYVRDAGGNLLAIYTEDTGTPLTQTEVPVYASGKLGIYKPEQQLYMYEVTDHLGNVRAVVIDNPFTLEFLATLETQYRDDEKEFFYNIEETAHMDDLRNHTPDAGGNDYRYSAWLNPVATGGKTVGPGFAIPLNPGDKVEIEAYAQYDNAVVNETKNTSLLAMALATAFGYTGGQETQYILDLFNSVMPGVVGSIANPNPDAPTAYIEYLFFDQNFNFDQVAGHDFVGDHGPGVWEKLDFDGQVFVADKPGYLYVSVANISESNVNVWFDDIKITLTESPVVVGNDYYPFGMPIADRSYERQDYRFGYQGQFSEKDDETGWNSFQLRMYDARIGRWISPDPYGQYYSSYVGMGNSPINGIDTDGGLTTLPGITISALSYKTINSIKTGIGGLIRFGITDWYVPVGVQKAIPSRLRGMIMIQVKGGNGSAMKITNFTLIKIWKVLQ